ncbi:NUDIX hydrolase [Tuberibacillus sp. Marseille-P3662]|uniref:NUDIX hydrolase n=1 Tax=Tuberibacillus sp. Marseille-P3662 TaxID=1965358 RepID=UPI000A1C9453|nr:NUDIX hydrolase [Tuberibacillus sp. Marseille-P3662]
MKKWLGSSGVCVNENDELLMVLQGKPDEIKTWSIPSGGQENNETFAECCIREIEEETGYVVEIVDEIKVKSGNYEELNISFEVHYFLVNIVDGERNIQDPDNLIYDIAWKSAEELKNLDLTYPEDKEFLIHHLQRDK